MILVNDLYLRWRDLCRKNKSGYSSNDEFNRFLCGAQNLLSDYYFAQFEANQQVPDAVRVFVETTTIPVANGVASYPSDYRNRLELYGRFVTNVAGGEPVITEKLAIYLHENEVGLTLESAVRGPSIPKKRCYHAFSGSGFLVYPTALGSVKLRYLTQPPTATRAVTVDATNDEEVYSSGSSVNLVWPAQCEEKLLDLLLYFSGLAMRDEALTQWVQSKIQ